MVNNSRPYANNLYIKAFHDPRAIQNSFCKRAIKDPPMNFIWHIIKAFFGACMVFMFGIICSPRHKHVKVGQKCIPLVKKSIIVNFGG